MASLHLSCRLSILNLITNASGFHLSLKWLQLQLLVYCIYQTGQVGMNGCGICADLLSCVGGLGTVGPSFVLQVTQGDLILTISR